MGDRDAFNKRILIADDEVAVSRLLQMLLSSRGYQTNIVSTGEDALRNLAGVDLILLDNLLPDCQGLELCQRIRSNPQTQNIPIIIITGQQGKNDKITSLYVGVDDYLTKPFEPEELFARIEYVLRHGEHVNKAQVGISAEQYQTVYELSRIVSEEDIKVFFQPIYFLKSMRLLGVEVLSRPQTKTAMSNPEIFFKNALKYGFYLDAEMIGWRKAVEQVVNYFDGRQKLFLNCNPYLIESDRFRNVKSVFSSLGFPSDEVFLEITERSAIQEYDLFVHKLEQYRQDGFNIAIDDVGGGYASLESIVETRPEVVKLDKHIVCGVCDDAIKRSIIKLIVAFCRENSIICVAEGIEHKKDYDALIELGVDAGQGYLLYRPTETIDLQAMQTLQF